MRAVEGITLIVDLMAVVPKLVGAVLVWWIAALSPWLPNASRQRSSEIRSLHRFMLRWDCLSIFALTICFVWLHRSYWDPFRFERK